MEKILVATDGSENSNDALIVARSLAEGIGSKVTIINVRANLPAYVQGEQVNSIIESVTEHQKKILEEALIIFQDYSDEVDTIGRKGEAGEIIIKEAERGNYDLIIMGSRGEGGFSKAILGSISNKVLNHIKKDVLIVKWWFPYN